jgi:hypothetical protein
MVKRFGPVTTYAARSHVEPSRTGIRRGRWFLELFLAGRYVGICR